MATTDPNAVNTSAPTLPVATPSATPAAPTLPSAQSTDPLAPVIGAPATGPTVTPGQTMSGNEPHGIVRNALQDLAGGKTTDFANTPNGPVPVKRNLQPGEIARNILASALSLMAAGTGGDLAAREKRPYVQPQDQSIGGMEENRVAARQDQAQSQFQNKRLSDQDQRANEQMAMAQQESIRQAAASEDAHEAHTQAMAEGSQRMADAASDQLQKDGKNYFSALAMPGAELMKGSDGKELSFVGTNEAQQYAIAHPDVLHGSTNGNNRYGVVIVKHPVTGLYQLIDYPITQNQQVISNFGQRLDKNGDPMVDKNGNPVPDGTVIDPNTKKPTVLTEDITPQQAQDIAKHRLDDQEVRARIVDLQSETNLRNAKAKQDDDLNIAVDLYNSGQTDKMSPRQKQIVSRQLIQSMSLANLRQKQAQDNYNRITSNGTNSDADGAKDAADALNKAKEDYQGSVESYQDLTGITPGSMLGNRVMREAGKNPNWPSIDAQIASSGLSDEEKQRAKNTAWNKLSPAQQAAARTAPAVQTQSGATSSSPLVKPPTRGAKIDVVDATRYVQAAGGDKVKARQMAQRDGWSF